MKLDYRQECRGNRQIYVRFLLHCIIKAVACGLEKGLLRGIFDKISSILEKSMLDCELRITDFYDSVVEKVVRDKSIKSPSFLNQNITIYLIT